MSIAVKILSLFGIIAMWLLVSLEISDLVKQAWDWLTYDRVGGVALEGLPEGIPPPPPPPPPPTPIFLGREGAVSILYILLYANTALIIHALRRQFGYEVFIGHRANAFVYSAMWICGLIIILWGAGYFCYAILAVYVFPNDFWGDEAPSLFAFISNYGSVFLAISLGIVALLLRVILTEGALTRTLTHRGE